METYEDIKLIACDMDGTLLDERSQVPPETFELVRALDAAGIRFVAASGRRYDTLRAFFEPVADRMDFVASNGAQVFVRGKLVDREVFSHAALRRLYALVEEFDNLHMVVMTARTAICSTTPHASMRNSTKICPTRWCCAICRRLTRRL